MLGKDFDSAEMRRVRGYDVAYASLIHLNQSQGSNFPRTWEKSWVLSVVGQERIHHRWSSKD